MAPLVMRVGSRRGCGGERHAAAHRGSFFGRVAAAHADAHAGRSQLERAGGAGAAAAVTVVAAVTAAEAEGGRSARHIDAGVAVIAVGVAAEGVVTGVAGGGVGLSEAAPEADVGIGHVEPIAALAARFFMRACGTE